MRSSTLLTLAACAASMATLARAEEMRRRLGREYAERRGDTPESSRGGGSLDLGSLLGGGSSGGGAGDVGGGPQGQAYAPKKSYRPQANGCGPAGMRQRDGDQYGLHECCNGHDTCYSACGSDFQYCEKQFKKCMLGKCEQNNGGAHCAETANSFASMTGMFGRGFHQQGMDETCECVPTAQVDKRNAEYFVHFYKTCVRPPARRDECMYVLPACPAECIF